MICRGLWVVLLVSGIAAAQTTTTESGASTSTSSTTVVQVSTTPPTTIHILRRIDVAKRMWGYEHPGDTPDDIEMSKINRQARRMADDTVLEYEGTPEPWDPAGWFPH